MNGEEKYHLPHSNTCFICGEKNEVGMKCRFYADSTGAVHLDANIREGYAGFTGVVHGGIQAAMLDETMGWCGFTQGEASELCFTRELSVKYRRNVPPDTDIYIVANLLDVKRNMYFCEGRIFDGAGNVLTVGSGTFIPISSEMMERVKGKLLYIDDGRAYLKKAIDIIMPVAAERH